MSNVVAPGSPGYEALRKPAIARFHDARPAAIALCAGPADVAEAIAFARRDGLPLAVRSGGHCLISAGCGPAVGISGAHAPRRARRPRPPARADLGLPAGRAGAGGARFGVVTSLVFETIPAPEATAFELHWAPAAAAARAWLDRSWALAHPYGTGGAYPNFPEDGLDPWAPEYLGSNRERLLGVKRRDDPDAVFV